MPKNVLTHYTQMTFKAFNLSGIFSDEPLFNGSPRNEDNNQPEGTSLIGHMITAMFT